MCKKYFASRKAKHCVGDFLLDVFDGLPVLDDAFRETYRKVDVRYCIVRKMRAIQ